MKSKTKPETESLLRVPKAKNKLGLKIHKIAMPHDDLIRAEKTQLELVENESLPSLPSMSSQTRQTKEAAPSKDFQKTPNSITRQAIPDGLFKGKSKQLYDALYSLTRGAIVPVRQIRIRKSKLMKLADIGSRATFDSNISHLQIVGLISETVFAGEHKGNQFEIFLPEETTSLPSVTSLASLTSSAQKQDRLVCLVSGQSRQSSESINTGVLDVPKTSLKDNTKNDDDARATFAGFIEKFQTAAEDVTGKKLSERENENLRKLADLLILELKIAARRTDNISSIPAFLTEVLRRKLRDTVSPAKSPKIKIDTVGKPESESYEIKPLDEPSREAALEQLREFAGDEFLQDFQKWYTDEDWSWLTKELGIN